MTKIGLYLLTAAAAVTFAACGGPADNKPANTANTANSNANSTKPAAAAPTADALLAMDKEATAAYLKGDGKFFDGFLSDKSVMYGKDGRHDKADTVKMIGTVKCDVKDGWKLEEPQMAKIDADTYVVSYKGTFDGTCTENGKSAKIPSPIRAASVYARVGDKWEAVYHGENVIVEPKAAPAADDKKAAPTKAEPKKEEPKKEEPKKADPKKDEKPAANAMTTTAPKAAGDANTEALVKIHQAGWEAWRTKDGAKLTETTTKDLSFIDPVGKWMSGQDNVVKEWINMKCEGVTKTNFTDGEATALSPTVEILTGKGWADGTCDGQKNGDLYTTAFYVKEGDAWKLAFMMESMPGM